MKNKIKLPNYINIPLTENNPHISKNVCTYEYVCLYKSRMYHHLPKKRLFSLELLLQLYKKSTGHISGGPISRLSACLPDKSLQSCSTFCDCLLCSNDLSVYPFANTTSSLFLYWLSLGTSNMLYAPSLPQELKISWFCLPPYYSFLT